MSTCDTSIMFSHSRRTLGWPQVTQQLTWVCASCDEASRDRKVRVRSSLTKAVHRSKVKGNLNRRSKRGTSESLVLIITRCQHGVLCKEKHHITESSP